MPAKSKDQATAAKIALQIKKGKQKAKSGTASAQMAKNMTKKQLRDFTKKESLKLVDDVMVEHGGMVTVIPKGTTISEINIIDDSGYKAIISFDDQTVEGPIISGHAGKALSGAIHAAVKKMGEEYGGDPGENMSIVIYEIHNGKPYEIMTVFGDDGHDLYDNAMAFAADLRSKWEEDESVSETVGIGAIALVPSPLELEEEEEDEVEEASNSQMSELNLDY